MGGFMDVGTTKSKCTLQWRMMTWKLGKNWRPRRRGQRGQLTRTRKKEASKKETKYTSFLRWTTKK